jgi:signal transduction histidine kinase
MKNIFLLFLFIHVNAVAQNNTIDSLKQLLLTSTEDTNKVWVLDALSDEYSWSFADTAVMYAQQELQLSQKLNFKKGEAYAKLDMGTALTTLGNYPLALDFLYKSLALLKSLQDSVGIIYNLNTIGVCYRDQEDYKQAIQYMQESLQLTKVVKHFTLTAEGMLSSVYDRSNQLDSALFYAEKVYERRKNWSTVLNVLGSVHYKLNHTQLAVAFYKEAITAAFIESSQINVLDAYNGIAKIYAGEGQTDSALYYAKQVLLQQWAKNYPIGMLHATALLAKTYELKNNSDSALKYLNLTINLNDSLFSQRRTREAQSFAFNKQLQQQELAAQQQENDSKLRMYFVLACTFIFLLIAFFLFRNNRHKQKAYVLLQKQKLETDKQKEKTEFTLHELKSTQAQLIQQEKMASLGELTAGIAHEIQNPLNFVNNFSEVNVELVDELKSERSKSKDERDEALEDEILNDVQQNLEKVLHHGKRADAIVKGMLQHSRASTGKKELTDINALADEYLRLSYHGMRAKDKNFNAEIKTNFDSSIGKINVVPQDIGRVLLNLFNNAFYAVSEKQKLTANGYQPIAKITTRKLNDKIEIRVEDNGNGIPQKVVDKIFQPFFTTKPTGQGTGLGLSLSYDIIKAHGGEIKVETKEGEGSEFIIQLPI